MRKRTLSGVEVATPATARRASCRAPRCRWRSEHASARVAPMPAAGRLVELLEEKLYPCASRTGCARAPATSDLLRRCTFIAGGVAGAIPVMYPKVLRAARPPPVLQLDVAPFLPKA